jgi:exodeoxyribonuclease V gamma subunit
MKITLSNQTEELLQRFKESLKAPLQKRLIIVSDHAIKSYLQVELTSMLFGSEILTLSQAAEKLLSKQHCPSSLELYYNALSTKKTNIEQWVKKETLDRRYTPRSVEVVPCLYEVIDLFAISSLCPYYYDLFSKQTVAVNLWVVSPCMMFWSDMCSDREASKLAARFDQELLYDRSPLLANCGVSGRNFTRFIDDSIEAYVVPDWLEIPRPEAVTKKVSVDKNALQMLQNQLLLLQKESQTSPDDISVKIHAAPTLLKEVQLLYDSLTQLSEPLLPLDCIIFAPDIKQYVPYIERVFKIPFQVYGVDAFKEGGAVNSFFKLIELVTSTYSAESLVQFFSNKAVREKLGYEREDLLLFKKAIERFGFFWGIDQNMRHKHEGSFAYFEEKFMSNWIGATKEIECTSTDAEKIATFLAHIRALYDSFATVHVPRSISQWICYFEERIEGYFAYDDEYDLIASSVKALRKCKPDCELSIKDFSFLVEKSVRASAVSPMSYATAPVVCSSLGAFRNHPARFIAILGLQEGYVFEPDVETAIALGATGSLYAVDKYLFLEAVLSTRVKLHCSFQSYSFEEKAALSPASMVTDLLAALPNCEIINHSLDDCVETVLDAPVSFFHSAHVESATSLLEVSKLLKLARSPLQPYFQNKMGLHLFDSEEKNFDDDFKDIDTYRFMKLKQQAFFFSETERKVLIENEFSHLPAPLKKSCEAILLEELAHLEQGLGKEVPVTVELSAMCQAPEQKSASKWVVPAVDLSEIGIQITGSVDSYVFAKKSADSTVKSWPKQLLLAYLVQKYELPLSTDLLFLEDAKRFKKASSDPKSELIRYCQFYNQAMHTPLCLYPRWVQKLLSSKTAPTGFFEDALNQEKDRYLQFFLSKMTPENFSCEWEKWQELAVDLYAAIGEEV